jgi:hypothetical protein
MNNLSYSCNVLTIYFSSLTLPELVMDRSVSITGYEFFTIGDAMERDSMVQLITHHPRGPVYYVFGRSNQDAVRDIFMLLCNMSMWVWLL